MMTIDHANSTASHDRQTALPASSRLDQWTMAAFILCFGLLNQMGVRRACVAQERPQIIGNSSCGTATCHGGVVGVGPAWHSSASVWESQDPHAHAGEVLLNGLSQRIVSALEPKAISAEERQRVLVQRCASCHAPAAVSMGTDQNVVSESTTHSVAELQMQRIHEGVSCETCHGAASKWLVPHTRVDWPTRPEAERYALTSGMLNTEQLASRTDGCVRCHVGSRTADGLIRDMNHDMIAAGHPQLESSMFALHSRLKAHWDTSHDALSLLVMAKSKPQIEDALRDRMLLSAVRLSVERTAEAKAAPDQPDLNRPDLNRPDLNRPDSHRPVDAFVPQPELSEYDCVACHRPYVANAQRSSRGLPRWQPQLTENVSLASNRSSNMPLSEELVWGRSALDRFLKSAATELDARTLQLLRVTPNAEPARGAR